MQSTGKLWGDFKGNAKPFVRDNGAEFRCVLDLEKMTFTIISLNDKNQF